MNVSKWRAMFWFVSLCLVSLISVDAQNAVPAPAPKSADSAVKAPAAAPAATAPAVASPAPAAVAPVPVVPAPAAPAAVAPAPAVPATSGEVAGKHIAPSGEGEVQTTAIEGIQISHEPGNKTDEILVSGYFIFKEKPANYFYEVKQKEKKIVFEFNDTKAPAAPIPQVAEPPIKKFTVEQRRIDINKDVRGITPEFHSQVQVTLFLDNIPDIHVNDQANVILFSYKWTTNPLKVSKYIIKPGSNGWIKYAAGGAVVAGVGVAFGLKGKKSTTPAIQPISTDDLPERTK